MKNKIRVLLVDSDVEQVSSIKEYFSKDSLVYIVNSINNGEDAINYIKDNINSFDVLIIDLLLAKKDGISVIKSLYQLEVNKNIIVTTSYKSLDVIKDLSFYNINYFILKPYDLCDLKNKIIGNNISNLNDENKELQTNITNLLHSFGVPSHIKGYEYIREGIGQMYLKPNLLGAVTKEMYPSIANKYNTTSSRVERAIRHAIEISWNRGDYDLMEEVFGNSVDFDRAKPTNTEFIATLADKLRLESK